MNGTKSIRLLIWLMFFSLFLGVGSFAFAEESEKNNKSYSDEKEEIVSKGQNQPVDLPELIIKELVAGSEYELALRNVHESDYDYIILEVWNEEDGEDDAALYAAEWIIPEKSMEEPYYQVHLDISNHKHAGIYQAVVFGVNITEQIEVDSIEDITLDMLSNTNMATEIDKTSFEVIDPEYDEEETASEEIVTEEETTSSETNLEEEEVVPKNEEETTSLEIPKRDASIVTLKSVQKSSSLAHGIDVSHHNGTIDWSAVKDSGIQFAIIRCGYGDNIPAQDDAKWIYNVTQCEKLGIPYGVYIYSYATNEAMAKSEAEHCIRLLKGHNPQYPVYLDLEDEDQVNLSNTTLLKITVTWAERMKAAGYKPGVYSNLYWWRTKLDSTNYNNYYRWVAQWSSSCTYTGTYQMWQYSSQGSVNGISGKVDMNHWYGGAPANTIGWLSIGGNYYFFNSDGKMVTGWLDRGGARYFFNDYGVMATGWRTIDGARYYFSGSGVMTIGWLKQGGAYYLFNSDGKMAVGWINRGGARYYFDNAGKMATGWRTIDGARYYFNSGGVMTTGWLKQGGVYYLLNSDGKMAVGWINRGGARYYFDNAGKMATGWRTLNGARYYFNGGAMTIGWLKQGGYYYLFNSNGEMLVGWQKRAGAWYYFRSTGTMITGKIKIGDNWHLFGNDGVLVY